MGTKKGFEVQNVLGIRGRKGKPNYALMMGSTKEKYGPHLEGDEVQISGQTQGVFAGPCHASIGEQSPSPTERFYPTNLRAESKGSTEDGMVNPSCSGPQESEVSVAEEKGSQETTSTQGEGCNEKNNIKKALRKEESCALKDEEGNKAREEGRNYCAPEKESPSGKFPNKVLFIADLDYAGVKDGCQPDPVDSSGNVLRDYNQARENSKCSPRDSALNLVCRRIEVEGEDDTRAERSGNPDGKGLGNTDGTRVESSGSERHYRLESQAVRFSGSGQNLGEGRGSDHVLEPSTESGRDLVPTTGLGLNSRVNEPTCFKAQTEILKTGLSQDLFSTPVETTDSAEPIPSSPEAGQEGNVTPHGEEEELNEVVVQVEGHNLKNRTTSISLINPPLSPSPFLAVPCFQGVFLVWEVHYRRKLWYL